MQRGAERVFFRRCLTFSAPGRICGINGKLFDRDTLLPAQEARCFLRIRYGFAGRQRELRLARPAPPERRKRRKNPSLVPPHGIFLGFPLPGASGPRPVTGGNGASHGNIHITSVMVEGPGPGQRHNATATLVSTSATARPRQTPATHPGQDENTRFADRRGAGQPFNTTRTTRPSRLRPVGRK